MKGIFKLFLFFFFIWKCDMMFLWYFFLKISIFFLLVCLIVVDIVKILVFVLELVNWMSLMEGNWDVKWDVRVVFVRVWVLSYKYINVMLIMIDWLYIDLKFVVESFFDSIYKDRMVFFIYVVCEIRYIVGRN